MNFIAHDIGTFLTRSRSGKGEHIVDVNEQTCSCEAFQFFKFCAHLRRAQKAFFKPKRVFVKRDGKGFPIGKRTLARHKANAQLRRDPHIPKRCEIRTKGVCVNHIMLTWAHAKKSRFIATNKDWKEAARCCLPCHQVIEAMSHAKMAKVVREAIARR